MGSSNKYCPCTCKKGAVLWMISFLSFFFPRMIAIRYLFFNDKLRPQSQLVPPFTWHENKLIWFLAEILQIWKTVKKVLLGENKMHMVFVMTACSLREEITICITWRLLVLNLCGWFSSQLFWVVSTTLQTVGRVSQVAMLDHTNKHTHTPCRLKMLFQIYSACEDFLYYLW